MGRWVVGTFTLGAFFASGRRGRPAAMPPRLVELKLARSVLVAALLFASRAAGAPMYVVTDLGTLGGPTSAAWGINGAGQVVGSAATAGNLASHAFLYSRGIMTDLGTLGGQTSVGQAINAAGQVTG